MGSQRRCNVYLKYNLADGRLNVQGPRDFGLLKHTCKCVNMFVLILFVCGIVGVTIRRCW